MKQIIFYFILLSNNIFSQCSFQTDYKDLTYTNWTNNAWVNQGTTANPVYTDEPTSSVYIINDQLEFDVCSGNGKNRIYRPHNITSLQNWSMDFDFNFTDVGSGGPGHFLAALTGGSSYGGVLDPTSETSPCNYNDPSVNVNTYWSYTDQDAIGAIFMSTNHTNDANTFMLCGATKDNNVDWTYGAGILLTINTQYYIRLERLSLTQGKISLYTTAARTVIISSQCFNIPNTISNNLKILQHGVLSPSGSDRSLTGVIDNMLLQKISVSGGQIGSNQTICYGNTPANLTNTSLAIKTPCSDPGIPTFNYGAFTYSWEYLVQGSSIWAPVPSSGTSSSLVFNSSNKPLQNTYYRRVATGDCGVKYYTSSVLVKVITKPTVTVNSSTICAGDQANLLATPSVGGGTYLWSNNSNMNSISVSPSLNTIYSVVYSIGNCSSLPASGTVTVKRKPTVTVNSVAICNGESATLTATPSGAGGTYSWSTGETAASIVVTPNATTPYSVIYTLNGCPSLPVTSTVTVTTPTVTVTSQPVCYGLPTNPTFTANGLPAGGTYLWSNGATTATTTAPYNTNLTVTYYTANGCSVTQSKTATNIILDASITYETNCPGTSYTIHAHSANIPGGTYSWTPYGQTTPDITVNPTTPTAYQFTFSVQGCSVSQSITLAPHSCMAPIPMGEHNDSRIKIGDLSNDITISPNPTNGKFNIDLMDVSAEKVVVYNMLGKVVSETLVTENARSLDIDLSELPASIYMVHVHTGSEVILKEVIKN